MAFWPARHFCVSIVLFTSSEVLVLLLGRRIWSPPLLCYTLIDPALCDTETGMQRSASYNMQVKNSCRLRKWTECLISVNWRFLLFNLLPTHLLSPFPPAVLSPIEQLCFWSHVCAAPVSCSCHLIHFTCYPDKQQLFFIRHYSALWSSHSRTKLVSFMVYKSEALEPDFIFLWQRPWSKASWECV